MGEKVEKKDYEIRIKGKQIERLPVGTIHIIESDCKYVNAHIEIPKSSWWIHFYTNDGKVHSIPSLQIEIIEWEEKWK